jgi:large subunit ribosomal protein L17
MTTSLIVHERIRTTDEKAKQLRRHVEKMITLAKHARALGSGEDKSIAAKQLHLRRQAGSFVRADEAVKKLFSELAERFAERPGGYTRIIKIGSRAGDCANMSYIELLAAEEKLEEKKPAKKAKKPAAKRTRREPKSAKKAEAAPTAEEPAAEPPAAEPPAPTEGGEETKE